MNKSIAPAVLLMASACSQQSPTPANQSAASHKPAAVPAPTPPAAPAPAPAPANASAGHAVVDPKGTDAALALVQGFADLLNAGKFDEAYMLLGPTAPPRAEFDRRLAAISHVHVSVSNPGPQEGAAGSIYLSVPIEISGDEVRKSATMIVRRVNDVPGSTAAQRRWHIERLDWGANG